MGFYLDFGSWLSRNFHRQLWILISDCKGNFTGQSIWILISDCKGNSIENSLLRLILNSDCKGNSTGWVSIWNLVSDCQETFTNGYLFGFWSVIVGEISQHSHLFGFLSVTVPCPQLTHSDHLRQKWQGSKTVISLWHPVTLIGPIKVKRPGRDKYCQSLLHFFGLTSRYGRCFSKHTIRLR